MVLKLWSAAPQHRPVQQTTTRTGRTRRRPHPDRETRQMGQTMDRLDPPPPTHLAEHSDAENALRDALPSGGARSVERSGPAGIDDHAAADAGATVVGLEAVSDVPHVGVLVVLAVGAYLHEHPL